MRLTALDPARFFAAFSVVMYHYTARNDAHVSLQLKEITKFGYLGVPLFFMISGYAISFSANKRSAIEFAVSRFVRLYPAYCVSLLITCATLVVAGTYKYSTSQVLANLTMLNDYLGLKNIDAVYWTLHAELKFYGCVFILLLFGVFSRFKVWLSAWLALTLLHLLTDQPFFMGWFISPFYSPFFIAGVAFFLIQQEGVNLYNKSMLIMSTIISGISGFRNVSGFIANPDTVDRLVAVLVILLFSVLFYLFVTDRISLIENRMYLILGGITYPLYLIHNVVGKTLIDSFRNAIPEWLAIVCVTLSIVSLSCLIHVGIEKKISGPMKMFLLSRLNSIFFSTSKSGQLRKLSN